MYKFSKTSLKHLNECDDRLILIANKAIERIDFSIIDGARTEEEAKKIKLKELAGQTGLNIVESLRVMLLILFHILLKIGMT